MEIISKQVTGDVAVISDTQYNNFNAENVIVEENILARFYGVIKKDLQLKKGAIVYLHGKLTGKLINEGGTLYVFQASGDIDTFLADS
jgi:hypothetical protein